MNKARPWWQQPDHFAWFSSYLRTRQMARMTRVVLVVISLSLAWIPPAMMFSTAPPRGVAGHVLAVLAGVGACLGASLWAARFPTRNQSIGFALLSCASIATAVLAQSDPLTAMFACTAFATVSGYVALFHSGKLMLASLFVAVAVSALPAWKLAQTNGVVWATCAGGLMLVVNVAVPFGIHFIVRALGVDVLRADRDPLTGLYNRRAFYQRTASLVATSHTDAHLMVAMIDLDKFKLLNDTRGHAEGDLVLAAVGRTLRQHAPHGDVVCRAGGEEFLVAHVTQVTEAPNPDRFGYNLCDAIGALPFQITASVGTASVRRDRVLNPGETDRVITAVIRAADEAMYVAKRNGGNRVRHHRPPAQLDLDARRWNEVDKRWECAIALMEDQPPVDSHNGHSATATPVTLPTASALNGSATRHREG